MSSNSQSQSTQLKHAIQAKIDGKIKPLGALGKIEALAAQIAQLQLTQTSTTALCIHKPTLCIFAGDHGVAKHNISIAPGDVTSVMVNCFLNGQAAINSFIKDTDWQLKVVNCGVLHGIPAHEQLIDARLGTFCGDISVEAALTAKQFAQAEQNAQSLIAKLDTNLIAFGEMGIGNTTSASAIFAKLFALNVEQVVGLGTGINERQLATKTALVQHAVKRVTATDAKHILQQLGSFEIATMVFAMLAAFHTKKLIVVDGFIVTAAAAIVLAIEPQAKHNMIFAHCSSESAHHDILQQLGVTPLLDLSLRLGEGTGAALCLPLIQAAVNFYNHMASFDDLGIRL